MVGPVDDSEVEELYPMSPSVGRLACLAYGDDIDFDAVVRAIQLDEALTTNVLRVANSAQHASRTAIDTVKQAVVRLGSDRILQLVVGGHVSCAMRQACDGYELDEYELWRHSVATALAAELVSQASTVRVPGAAFTAALLHDIGKLLLDRHLGRESVENIRNLMTREGMVYIEAERQVLGTDHAHIGGAVVHRWRFPDELVRAIGQHHNPDTEPTPVLDTVHVANLVAKLIGVGLGTEQMNLRASALAAARLGLRAEDIDALCAETLGELHAAEEMYRGVASVN